MILPLLRPFQIFWIPPQLTQTLKYFSGNKITYFTYHILLLFYFILFLSDLMKILISYLIFQKIEETQNLSSNKRLIFSSKQWVSKIDVYKEEFEELKVEKQRKDSEMKELQNKITEVDNHLRAEGSLV